MTLPDDVVEPPPAPEPAEPDGADAGRARPWWRGDHPVAGALVGFYAGLLFVVLVPSVYAGLARLLLGAETAERIFPWVLLALLVPIGLAAFRRTRRFGLYMLLGVVSTAVVVVVVGAVVVWFLLRG